MSNVVYPTGTYQDQLYVCSYTGFEDIALVRLNSTLPFGRRVQKIELAKEHVPPNATVQIVGFGFDESRSGVVNVTQSIDVQVVSVAQCQQMYDEVSPDQGNPVHEGNLCTYSRDGKRACYGDSGSPVIWNGMQVAVVDWNQYCEQGYPDMIHILTLVIAYISVGIIGTPSFAADPIFGGTEAKEGAAPYQVSLQITFTDSHKHFCGGSIIGDRWILTANHCVADVKPCCISVLVGTNDNEKGGTRYLVDRVLPHDLHQRSSNNDIALVRLATSLKFSKRVQQIKYSMATVPDNATLTATGWGLMLKDDGSKQSPNKLQTLDVRHVALDRCKDSFAHAGHAAIVSDTDLCTLADKDHQGLCSRIAFRRVSLRFAQSLAKGDSGSPVIWKGQQVAVVSRSTVTCAAGLPDLHTRVSLFHDWIQKTIADNSD
uniref:trypsin n=1 Tax=Anopheles stephensi TaxID=30069 RepID=A0A182YLC0_ANOST